MSAVPPTRCPLCNRTPRRRMRLGPGIPLWQCPRCRLAWWPWRDFDPATLYNEAYFQSERSPSGYNDYTSLEPGIRRTARARLRRIERLRVRAGIDTSPHLLEIGCGTGVFLDEARRRGWIVSGLETSRWAAGCARARGLDVAACSLEEADLSHETYGCIALWDVIEHLRDPLAAVSRAARALRPGGVLALSTGDVTSLCARFSGPRWHLFNLPEHLFFFSPTSLRALLTRNGCTVAHTTREVNWVPIGYLLERLHKTLGVPRPRTPLRPNRWLAPATLFDVLGVYATRAHEAPATSRSASTCQPSAAGVSSGPDRVNRRSPCTRD